MIAFIRAFGLHRPDRTPCGEPIPVSQAHALSELEAGPLTQVALARALTLESSTVSRLVDALAARGWARRVPNPQSRRSVLVALTAKGQRAAGRLSTARRARYAALLESLTDAEATVISEAASILASATVPERVAR